MVHGGGLHWSSGTSVPTATWTRVTTPATRPRSPEACWRCGAALRGAVLIRGHVVESWHVGAPGREKIRQTEDKPNLRSMPQCRARPRGTNTVAMLGQAYSLLGFRIVDGVVGTGFPQKPSHSAVFAQISPEGSRLTDLAAGAGITPQSMGALVDELVELGYVERRAGPAGPSGEADRAHRPRPPVRGRRHGDHRGHRGGPRRGPRRAGRAGPAPPPGQDPGHRRRTSPGAAAPAARLLRATCGTVHRERSVACSRSRPSSRGARERRSRS